RLAASIRSGHGYGVGIPVSKTNPLENSLMCEILSQIYSLNGHLGHEKLSVFISSDQSALTAFYKIQDNRFVFGIRSFNNNSIHSLTHVISFDIQSPVNIFDLVHRISCEPSPSQS